MSGFKGFVSVFSTVIRGIRRNKSFIDSPSVVRPRSEQGLNSPGVRRRTRRKEEEGRWSLRHLKDDSESSRTGERISPNQDGNDPDRRQGSRITLEGSFLLQEGFFITRRRVFGGLVFRVVRLSTGDRNFVLVLLTSLCHPRVQGL